MKGNLGLWVVILGVALGSPSPAQEPKGKDVDMLVVALGSQDAAERAAAIEALTKLGKKAVPQLTVPLESAAASVLTKTGVIEVLGGMKKAGAAVLEERLLQPIHAGSINGILNALDAILISGPTAKWTTPSLTKLIERKPDKAFLGIHMLVRASAIMTLGRLGPNTPAVTTLLAREMKGDDTVVRLSSACALWWTGSEPNLVYPALIEGLKETGNSVALERAIFGLGEMGSQAKDAVPELERLREQVSAETRTGIVEALAKINGHRPPIGPRAP